MATQKFSATVLEMKEILAQRDKTVAELQALEALLKRVQKS